MSESVPAKKRSRSTKRGRPPEAVPQDKAETVLAQMVSGTALARVCEQPGMPGITTVFDWQVKDATFAERFRRAREVMAYREVDEALEIADTATPENVQVAKLRVETRLKRAACFCPSMFGTRQQSEGVGIVQVTVVTGVPQRDKSPSPHRVTVESAPPRIGSPLSEPDSDGE